MTGFLATGRLCLLPPYDVPVELRQLRYFVAVAEELNFARAAHRLHIAGPSLSQQIKALERDLQVQLFDRDRRSVALTTAGAVLLPKVRDLLARADELRTHATGLADTEPVRLGYVSWRPADMAERTAGVAQLHIDTWVLPSHAQAARVSEHTLDLAICWIPEEDLKTLGLDAEPLGADLLHAVAPGPDTSAVDAKDTVVLSDADTASWSSWNQYGEWFARDAGAHRVRIEDGGITGPAFFEHVRRLRRPVLNSPKSQTSPLPTDLVRRPVIRPRPYWPWWLVSRQDEARASVAAVIAALTRDVGDLGMSHDDAWSPRAEPGNR
jgi:DNA-binding transcriptional LysR family regulator